MKNVKSDTFWGVIDALDKEPLGARPVVEIDMTADGTFTQVTVGGHPVGEEVSCHRSGRTQCYLVSGEAAA